MDRTRFLKVAKIELLRHNLDTFVDNPSSVAEGGTEVVVPGCAVCRKKLQTVNQLMQHLADDVLPVILRKALAIAGETS